MTESVAGLSAQEPAFNPAQPTPSEGYVVPDGESAIAETQLPTIAFYEPCIPHNTGATIRLSAVTGAPLHLIEPLGFDLSETQVKRAGLDYHDMARVTIHDSFEELRARYPKARILAFSSHAEKHFTDVTYGPDDILLFGPEPTGLPDEVLNSPDVDEKLLIPMLPSRRSLNLSICAALVVYEAWRQQGFTGSR